MATATAPEKVELVLKLRAEGVTHKECARQAGISERTVSDICKRAGHRTEPMPFYKLVAF